jgi:hypothetical protein
VLALGTNGTTLQNKTNGHAVPRNGKKPSNEELMAQMGSENGYDPIPPDQYLYFLNDRDPLQRLLAYVRSKTIRVRHRSSYCVDEYGNPITLEQIAADFGWSLTHARQTWADAEERGLVKRDQDDRLCLCGNVPLPPKPNCKLDEAKKNCTVFFPQYLRQQIQQLSKNSQDRLQSEIQAYTEFEDRLKSDALALAREILEDCEERFFARYGLELRRNKKTRENNGREFVQVKLNTLPNQYAELFENFVQDENPILYKAENPVVQDSYPLIVNSTEGRVGQSVSSVLEVAPADRPTDSFPSDRPEEHEELPPLPAVPASRTVVIDPLHKAVYASIPIELFIKLQDLPSPHLLTQMYLNLAGAPPEHLTHKIRQRWDAITSMGLLAGLAKDVGDAYRQLQELAPKPESATKDTPTRRQQRIESLRLTLETLADETFRAECPEQYRQLCEDIALAPPDEVEEARRPVDRDDPS